MNHVFNYMGQRIAISNFLVMTVFLLMKQKDPNGIRHFKVGAVKLLRTQLGIGLREALRIAEFIDALGSPTEDNTSIKFAVSEVAYEGRKDQWGELPA